MENEPADTRCGAKLRGKNRFCQKRPMAGRRRCRLHGGATPKSQFNALKHGFRAKKLPAEEREAFQRHLRALLTDPKTALLASAAVVHTHAERLMNSAPGGFLKLETTRKTVKGGEWDTDDGVTMPGSEVETERTEKHVEIIGPLAEALHRAAVIVQKAHDADKSVAAKQLMTVQREKLASESPSAGGVPLIPGDAEYDEMLLREWGYKRTGMKKAEDDGGKAGKGPADPASNR